MTEYLFILRDQHIRDRAVTVINALALKPVLMEVVIRPFENTRTSIRNAKYWAELTECLEQINATVNQIASDTGHSPLEVKREAAGGLPIEYGIILFAKKPEVAHEVLKDIANIPTTTKLGTKRFIEHEDRMLAVMGDILGHVKAMV